MQDALAHWVRCGQPYIKGCGQQLYKRVWNQLATPIFACKKKIAIITATPTTIMTSLAGERKKKEWEDNWEQDRTVFHKNKVDARLKKYIDDLTRGKGDASVLVTWCGKSLDVPWLCSEGYTTVGVELSETGVKQLFEENDIPHTTSSEGQEFVVYKATNRNLKVFVGNFYKLTPEIAGTYDCVWDHNALGAAEPAEREAYRSVLVSLLKPGGRVLLSNYEFDAHGRDCAPYSLSTEEIKDMFGSWFDVKFLEYPDEFVEFFKSEVNVDWVRHSVHLLTLK